MTLTPMPTQIEDAAFLVGDNDLSRGLYSEPGTGKTLTAILGMQTLTPARCLIVCPAIAVGMWVDALTEAGVDRVANHISAAMINNTDLGGEMIDNPVLILTYAVAAALGAETLYRLYPAELVIADEAHYAVRDTAARSRLLWGDGRSVVGLHQLAERVWPLTGSPIIRYADDMWPIMRALWPGYLTKLGVARDADAFSRRFCQTRRDPVTGRLLVTGNRQWALVPLHETLYGRNGLPAAVVRRRLADVAKFLPPTTETVLRLPMTAAERKDLEEALPPDWQSLEEEPLATARRLLGRYKAEPAAQHLLGLDQTLALYWHREVGDAVAERLREAGRSVMRIDGGTPTAVRDASIRAFNEGGPDRPILLGQIGSMGVAANLQASCSRVVVIERDWSPSVMQQAVARVHRLGQTATVHIDWLEVDHALEWAIRDIAAAKQAGMDLAMEGRRT
jgi:SNF2 family DNA or RNA helicase